MIEHAEKTRFRLEARELFRRSREPSAQNLDGDVAPKLGVGRPIDVAIPPEPIFSAMR